MKRFLSFTLILQMLLAPTCFGEVLYAPASTPMEEYAAALKVHPEALSPSEDYLQIHPSLKNLQRLTQNFSQAEKTFMESPSQERIVQAYKKVLTLENQEDWKEGQRKLFLTAYLRLLQMDPPETSDTEKRQWTERALFYLDELEAPQDLIPPPILRTLEDQRALFPVTSLNLPPEIQNHFQKILLQGRIYSTASPLSLRALSGKVRVVLLGDFYRPQSFEIPLKEISTLSPQRTPYVTEDCPLAPEPKVYRPLHCVPPSPSKEISLPLVKAAPKESWKMSKKSWLWAGVGIAAGVLLISKWQQDQKKKDPPTEAYGF
jgi:hypothetical protein